MKVVRAAYAGACYGVQRALDLALKAVEDGGCAYTLGPLIHNPQVVAQLAECGVRAVDSVEDVAGAGTVVIRSHGVTPEVKRSVAACGLPLVDATCPHVARAQRAAADLAEQGRHVVVVGEAGHPEVEGLVACAREAGAPVSVVAGPDDLPETLEGPVGVVVQTTQTREALDAVVAALEERGVQLLVKNTICFATRQRQEAAAALAGEVDAMVVIGGRNSSNTTRLADICAAACSRTHHVESPDEIDPAWLAGCAVVGVTAGASTPEEQIEAVATLLEAL
ncbi:4-hydroxy-3-methylbut-2-enyl diphosphate reductase [Gordonibacter urolithinfaciens]|uniref:4-hydroxy-3-methylbut-2-enyl diphosphate reductase n=1 Tax=Gordonibacter urolithinfaciens TaxID=1335613 RepID=A0A6N8IJ32_9ACTN|nr:4-hydroxy-3-methylbut-2-enyl diphosphate reductase [Gordonibacter urolithinfaciens]MVN15901.1 4-hydroxy-3-methylbut-2-enyl diphosphate reductase [Gordonibacter urolithinfaciens]MVN39227.1 4-hydroxy-3-methylbut-2-enyl diphosphate reductase [Gordonibacter urolithinfaciens]MVN56066.1 4-hydroxy-3-methylbut-2-enyl diphosphate reductase [Gordonibacter urolithinfaciens]MVN61389.1 4-hydroxy-3-methylbut-2-enyl diphosphate reductase [Gordonibacter urolithinfaciens]